MPATAVSELLEEIHSGEDGYLALKEVRFADGKLSGPKQNDLADELAAFANSRGGVLVLGVHDETRSVLGIPVDRLGAVEALVLQACEDSITPPVLPVIERMSLPDGSGAKRVVMRVEAPPGLLAHRSPGGYFRRVGSSKCQMRPDQLARLFQQRDPGNRLRFDETQIPQAVLADMEEALWLRFNTSRTTGDPEHLLSNLAMASTDVAGAWCPTVAGALLACKEPERFLPNAFIQAVAYSGSEVPTQERLAYQNDAQDITGPLDQQVFGACAFVRKNMRVAAQKNPAGGRVDRPQFDMLAVFEAMVNAVAHRDYSMAGSKVRLRLFGDRLELRVPGSLPNTMTLESMPYRQVVRNEAIASLLARCPVGRDDFANHRTHIMDKRGEGVPIILERSEQLSGRLPAYRLVDESELWLTIYAAQAP